MHTTGTRPGDRFARFRNAVVYHRENVKPTATINGLNQNWTNQTLTATVQAHDDGIGFCTDDHGAETGIPMSLQVTNQGGNDARYGYNGVGYCKGSTYDTPAPSDAAISWTEGGGDTSMIPEGAHDIDFLVSDMFANTQVERRLVRIDRTKPQVNVGGRLGAYATARASATSALPASLRSLTGPADVVLSIDDFRSGPATSGVNTSSARLIKLLDATNQQDTSFAPIQLIGSNPACAGQENCNRDGVRTVLGDAVGSTNRLLPGLYQIEVSATDRAGNVTQDYYVFAKSGGEITTVAEGQGTSRWLPLQAKRTAGSPTQATFQWQSGTRGWANIPGEALQRETDSAVINSASVAVTSGETGRYALDIEELIKRTNAADSTFTDLTEGRMQIRAEFNGSGTAYERRSEDVAVFLDRGGRDTDDDTQDLGTGTVDLLTGNFNQRETDATLDGYQSSVSVQRTYSSRYVAKTDGSRFAEEEDGLFGPGWTMSLEPSTAGGYVRAVDLDDSARDAFDEALSLLDPDYDAAALPEERTGAVRIESAEGIGIVFERRESDGTYVPEAGYESLRLVRQSSSGGSLTTGYVLTDGETGEITTFGARLDDATRPYYEDTPQHGTFGITRTDSPGTPGVAQWQYQPFGDPSRNEDGEPIDKSYQLLPVRVTSAHDGTLSCPTSGALPRGCSSLDFTYARLGAPSRFRLTGVSMTATDPATGSAAAPRTLATYAYTGDSAARLWKVTDAKTSLATEYSYNADGLLTTVTPPGEAAQSITYQPHVDDKTKGRVRTVSRAALPGTATWTVVYSDRTFNGANPWDLSTIEVAKWGQQTTPFRATAIIPPDVAFGVDQATLRKASISYLDALGRNINDAAPGGAIASTDYDKWGSVTRTLSAAGRAAALAATPSTVDEANRRSSFTFYEETPRGVRRVVRAVGPVRTLRLKTGSESGRSVTVTEYDKDVDTGAALQPADPFAPPYSLPSVVRRGGVTGASITGVGGTDREMRVTKTEFDLGTRLPKRVIADAGGSLENVRRFIYDADGKEIERRQPKNPGTATAGSAEVPTTTKTTYYASAGTASTTSCGGRPEWVGLVCTVDTGGAQPASGNRKLPVKRIFYDVWRRPTKVVETAITSTGVTETRTSETTFDSKERPRDETVVGSTAGVGTAIEKVRHVYDDATGREIETQHLGASDTVLRTVKRTYDTLGRVTQYDDSTGGKQVSTFDLLSRPSVVNQWNGATQIAAKTYTYDAVTGALTGLKDDGLDAATAMTATYDADGSPLTVTYPSGVTKAFTYAADGELQKLSYVKSAGCSSNCLWYQDEVSRSPHGQIIDDVSTLSTRKYDYDTLGRLTSVNDTAAAVCTTRTYAYDANSNRLTRHSAAAAAGAACPATSTGSVQTSTYDSSDRLASTDAYGLGAAAPSYDAWGRTLVLPKQASGGGLSVESTYFVNDLARSIKNGTVTVTNELDPLNRIRSRTTQTNGQSTIPIETYAYGDDSDAPIFTRSATAAAPTTQTGWTRFIEDPTGGLAAQRTQAAGSGKLQIASIRGDTVAEAPATTAATGITASFAVDEFGVPTGTSMGQRKYGFIGSKQRESLLYGSVIAMGVRTYSPHTGRFLQPDPVLGGSANPYDYAYQDPINKYDLDGRCTDDFTQLIPCIVAVVAGAFIVAGRYVATVVARALYYKALRAAGKVVSKKALKKARTSLVNAINELVAKTKQAYSLARGFFDKIDKLFERQGNKSPKHRKEMFKKLSSWGTKAVRYLVEHHVQLLDWVNNFLRHLF